MPDSYKDLYALRAAGMTGSEIRALFSVLERPEIISLAGGNTDTSIVAHRIKECSDAILERHVRGKDPLGYGSAGGMLALREQLALLMGTEGIQAEPHQILVTDGAQQALEFLAKIFCDPGDLILTEAPTYVGALDAFGSYQTDIQSVATDDEGVIPQALDEKLQHVASEGRRAKFLYLVPTFQNPSGITLTEGRRPRIIEICQRHSTLIVEDNPYAQVRFEGEPVSPLRSLTDDGIIYLGTLSKVVCPGIRIGWVLAPEPVRERLELAKGAADLCSSPLTQLLAAEYLSSGHVQEDLELVRKTYRERRNAIVDALASYFPSSAVWTNPEGGLFVWATLPAPIDTKAMLARCLEAGAAYVPGTAFYPRKRDGRRSMRLNFSYPSVDDIEEGIRRIGGVVAKDLEFARLIEAE